MKFEDLAKIRRSMRKFTDVPLTEDQSMLILRAALMAPSSKGLHAWHFVVVDDKDKISQLSGCKAQGADFLANAPLVVAVVGEPEVSDVWIEDCSVATTMMLLQAEDLGIGSCWVQVRERFMNDGTDAEDIVRSILNIPSNMRVLSLVALGNKGMERKPFNEERLLWEKVHVNEF